MQNALLVLLVDCLTLKQKLTILKSKKTVSVTLALDRNCRALFGRGDPLPAHFDD